MQTSMVHFYLHSYAHISYQYSRKQKNIAITDHNIIFRKEKGYMVWLKVINHHQAQLQEQKRGYISQKHFRFETSTFNTLHTSIQELKVETLQM